MELYKNISQLVTLHSAYKKNGRSLRPDDLSIIENGAIVFNNDEIAWVGRSKEIPKEHQYHKSKDLTGKVLLPEIVDSHTHLIFSGDRSEEYKMRMNGADYQEIADAGGGILSTMRATRKSSREDLFAKSIERIERIHSYGVGTIEIKSGYGLSFEKEYEISHIIAELKKYFAPKINIINTFMAAHAIPPEFKESHDYIEEVVLPLMDKLSEEKIIDVVDIFHENNYFTTKDVETVFKKAKELDLNCKSHADEFMDNNGASLASSFHAISTDHLLKTSAKGIEALANSETVATFLPGTAFFLGKEQVNARKFLDAGVRVALASDYNPGSCHCDNLLLLASLAAPTYKMNQCELWTAITLNAAHALGLKTQGALVEKLKPRFSIFDVDSIDKITYNWGRNFYLDIN